MIYIMSWACIAMAFFSISDVNTNYETNHQILLYSIVPTLLRVVMVFDVPKKDQHTERSRL